jgi:hypothetical protein
MPELVKENLSFESFATERDEAVRPSTKERYLFLALTSLLAVNLVVIFGALTFYYLLIQR